MTVTALPLGSAGFAHIGNESTTQILFSIDFPFAREPVAYATIEGLARYDGLDEAARRAIERDKALSLLPMLRERVVRGSR